MTPLIFVGLSIAGGIGAALRLLVDGLIKSGRTFSYPVATTIINVSGSFLLGLLTGLAVHHLLPGSWESVLGAGLLGGYTTFSTASFETVRLAQEKWATAALLNGLGMLVGAVAAAALGLCLGTSV